MIGSVTQEWLEVKYLDEFRRVVRGQDAGVTTDMVWFAVKRYAKWVGFDHLAPQIFDSLALASAMPREASLSRFSFSLVMRRCKRPNGISDAGTTSEKRSMIDFGFHFERCDLPSLGAAS